MYRLGLREKRRFRVCRTRNLGRMQTGLKKPRLYIHHLFGLMQFTVQYCFHVICMYVPKCRDGRHRQISGRFPMSHVDLGHRSHVETSAHVDLGTIGSGLRTTWAKTPGGIQHCWPQADEFDERRKPGWKRRQDLSISHLKSGVKVYPWFEDPTGRG